MNLLIALIIALWSGMACATELHVLDVNSMSMEYWKIADYRDGYTNYGDRGGQQEHWVDGAALNFDLTAIRYQYVWIYWKNRVHMDDTNDQVRHVGWEWEYGVDLAERVDLFWYHHSQHTLEAAPPDHYPLVNNYGVRVYFIGGRK